MKYLLTALMLIFTISGCSMNSVNNPKVETKHTITTMVINITEVSSADASGMVGPGSSLLTAGAVLIATANAKKENAKRIPGKDLTNLRINGKRIKLGCSYVKSKGKLVLTYKDDKETIYVRENNRVDVSLYGFGTEIRTMLHSTDRFSEKLKSCKYINKTWIY